MLALLIQGLTLGLIAAATPGVFQVFCVSQTLQKGWQRALPVALAPLVSDTPIIVLTVLILTALPPLLLNIMQWVGGLFLIYLAWGAWQAVGKKRDDTQGGAGSLLDAAVINLLNPNPYIFWSTVGGTILLEAWRVSAGHAAAFLVGMYATLVGGFAVLILSTGLLQTRGKSAEPSPLSAWLGRLPAVALFLFGIYQLVTAIQKIL